MSAFIRIGPPSLAGFTAWLPNVAGISTTVLPSSSPIIGIAYQVSWDTVNPLINAVAPNEYTLVVYNLATHDVVCFAMDQLNAPPIAGSDPPMPFFEYTRFQLKVNAFTPGVVASTSDEGTSVSLLNPDFMKTFGMSDTQLLKTPWGRTYMGFAQKFGTLWGLS